MWSAFLSRLHVHLQQVGVCSMMNSTKHHKRMPYDDGRETIAMFAINCARDIGVASIVILAICLPFWR